MILPTYEQNIHSARDREAMTDRKDCNYYLKMNFHKNSSKFHI